MIQIDPDKILLLGWLLTTTSRGSGREQFSVVVTYCVRDFAIVDVGPDKISLLGVNIHHVTSIRARTI